MRDAAFVTAIVTTLFAGPRAIPADYQDSEWQTANRIMGRNFIDPIAAEKFLEITYTERQYQDLTKIPFSKTTLEECKDTHILFPGYPLSLADLRGKSPMKIGFSAEDTSSWLVKQPFATKERVVLRWYLIRKTPVPTAQRWAGALPKELHFDEQIPTAVELVYAIVLHYLRTGKRMFRFPDRIYTSCASGDAGLNRL